MDSAVNRLMRDILPFINDPPAGRYDISTYQVEEGGFTGPIRANDGV